MFKVLSPTLETLTEGPKIDDLEDFLRRLAKNTGQDAKIEGARKHNLTRP